jgi:OOP family OmpA-OmpF porin
MAQPSAKILTLSALIAAASTGVSAQDHSAEINLGIGRILFGNELDDTNNYHLGLGFPVSERFTLEIVANEYDADAQDTGVDVRGTQFRLDGLYHFGTESWRPYVAFGAGDQRLSPEGGEPSHETLLNAGVGLKNRFARNWEWRTDVRMFNSLDEEYTDVVFSTGISFLFGASAPKKTAPAVAPAPAPVVVAQETDSDGDGVLDSRDKCPGTPRQYKVDSDGCVMKLTETVAVNLAVKFDTNSAAVKEEYMEDIRNLATFMNQYENTVVTVEGHTDSSGSDAYNKTLSQRRANAVRDVLIQRMNIEADRVTAVGFGEERPVADNDTVEGRETNRRVVGAVSTKVTVNETRE